MTRTATRKVLDRLYKRLELDVEMAAVIEQLRDELAEREHVIRERGLAYNVKAEESTRWFRLLVAIVARMDESMVSSPRLAPVVTQELYDAIVAGKRALAEAAATNGRTLGEVIEPVHERIATIDICVRVGCDHADRDHGVGDDGAPGGCKVCACPEFYALEVEPSR